MKLLFFVLGRGGAARSMTHCGGGGGFAGGSCAIFKDDGRRWAGIIVTDPRKLEIGCR